TSRPSPFRATSASRCTAASSASSARPTYWIRASTGAREHTSDAHRGSSSMAVARTSGLDGRLTELRRARRLLRAERSRIGQWRRLVRARLDLAVAAAAQPEPLGQEADVLPVGPETDLPMHAELVTQVLGGGPSIDLDRLEALRDLDRRLARYEEAVSIALDTATSEFIRRVAADPGEMCSPLTGS